MKLTPQKIVELQLFFSIPIYQRLFEWNEENILTLLGDLKRTWSLSNGQEDYFIGMLTSTKESELVDGQQRFTVMMLLGCVLQKYYSEWEYFLRKGKTRLNFLSRPKDDAYLQSLIDGSQLGIEYKNIKMEDGIKHINAYLENIDESKRSNFAVYIYEHMCFFISNLPDKYSPIDLNKYFERMNTSGKNLEQHEILKVKLLSNLDNNISLYMQLWNLLADVDTILIRKHSQETIDNLRERKRKAFDGNITNIASLGLINNFGSGEHEESLTIAAIQSSSTPPSSDHTSSQESKCALRFSYLLLQTLYWKIGGKIIGNIDDFFNPANLLDTFAKYLSYEGSVDKGNIIDFIDRLLLCRLALDICFIRTTDYGYSLDMLASDEDDTKVKNLLMLESMLFVSSSNYTNYKWFGCLMDTIKSCNGIPDVATLYNSFKNFDNQEHNILPTLDELSFGSDIRYWFWRLDYYIWYNRKEIFNDDEAALNIANNYVFRRNRSIEHVSPQTPMSESTVQWDNSDTDKTIRNSFGNLVMISQGLNSSLSNESYEVKRAHVESYYYGSRAGSIESLKLLLIYKDYPKTWNKETIKTHGEKAYRMLQDTYVESNGIN